MRHVAFLAFAVISCSIAPVHAASPTTVPATTRPAGDLGDAFAALASADYTTVLSLTSAIEADLRRSRAKPTDAAMVNCLHVRAVAMSRQGQLKPAADLMQRCSPLAMSNRALLVNLAIADLGDLSLLPRSVKNLQAFATANPTDEFAVNLWGMAIGKLVAADKVGAAKLKEWNAAFEAANRRLEQTRPSMRHWGSEWMNATQYAEVDDQRRSAQYAINDAQQNLASADRRVLDARREVSRVSGRPVEGDLRWIDSAQRAHDDDVAYAKRQLQSALDDQASAKSKWTAALSKMPRPTFVVDARMVEPILVK